MGRNFKIVCYIIFGIVASGFILAFLRTNRHESGNHQIHPSGVGFSSAEYDFGKILQNEQVIHEFCLTNIGPGEVRIQAFHTSCSCTVVLAENLIGYVIAPRSGVIFPVTFDSGTRDGHSESTIEVVLEGNGKKYLAQARLVGEVIGEFFVDPPAIDFGALRPGETSATKHVVLRPREKKRIAVTSIKTHSSGVNASVVQPSTVAIKIHSPNTSRRETYSEILHVGTSSVRVPIARVDVRYQVVPDVEITPDVFVIPQGGVTSRKSFNVTIETRYPSKLIRTVCVSSNGVRLVQPMDETVPQSESWNTSHFRQIAAGKIEFQKQLDFELEVRNEAGQVEARTASVEIMSLN